MVPILFTLYLNRSKSCSLIEESHTWWQNQDGDEHQVSRLKILGYTAFCLSPLQASVPTLHLAQESWWLPGLSPRHRLLLCQRSRPNTISVITYKFNIGHQSCAILLAQIPTCGDGTPSPGAISSFTLPESPTLKQNPFSGSS